jgi:biotin---protein ligase
VAEVLSKACSRPLTACTRSQDARDPTKLDSSPSWIKIGGILVNCVYSSGSYQVVLGTGINTSNKQPTTSLNALIPPSSGLAPFRIERLLAAILVRTESIYRTFCRDGFSPDLEARYYRHWLHTGQVVTLDGTHVIAGGRGAASGAAASVGPAASSRARILGITPDYGMLRAEELYDDADGEDRDRPTGRVLELESDYNSFDFFRGLVRRKV